MAPLLDAELVEQLRSERGVTRVWLYRQLGLSKSAGYALFRDGILPKDETRQKFVLDWLANYLGKEVPQILLRPGTAQKTA